MSFYDNRQHWAALPMGEVHAFGECAFCGVRGEVDKGLERVLIMTTHAMGLRCRDHMACIRRRARRAA